jgi:hypothetical protein
MDSVTRFYPRKISLLQVLVPGLKFEYGFESLRYSIRQVVKIGFSDLSKTENSPLCLRFLVKLYVFFLLRIVFTRKDKKKDSVKTSEVSQSFPRSHWHCRSRTFEPKPNSDLEQSCDYNARYQAHISFL